MTGASGAHPFRKSILSGTCGARLPACRGRALNTIARGFSRCASFSQQALIHAHPPRAPLVSPDRLSRANRFGRAKGLCEGCGRPHGQQLRHLGDGRWWDEAKGAWRNGNGRPSRRQPAPGEGGLTTRVVLATAHLDHDPTNNRPGNLRALCQRCHTLHDRQEHIRRRWLTYRTRKAIGDLFAGPYRA